MRAMQFFKDLSLSAFVAGFVAVLVGFTSSVAIVFQAAQSFGATPAQITSWIWALGLGMGLCSLVPSLLLRKPVMVAWSTRARRCWLPGLQAVSPWARRGCLHGLRGADHSGGRHRLVRAWHDRIPMEIASACWPGCWPVSACRPLLLRKRPCLWCC
jgi:benzoate membrane transport protein